MNAGANNMVSPPAGDMSAMFAAMEARMYGETLLAVLHKNGPVSLTNADFEAALSNILDVQVEPGPDGGDDIITFSAVPRPEHAAVTEVEEEESEVEPG
jgi:hypothetical protein